MAIVGLFGVASAWAGNGVTPQCAYAPPPPASYVAAVNHWNEKTQNEIQNLHVPQAQSSFLLQPKPGDPGYVAPPNGRVAVLVHGLSDSPQAMRDLAQVYLSQGFTVIGLRLSGHGTSMSDLDKNGTADNWENDVADAMKTAGALGSKVSLVGYSTGGALALNYAMKDRLGENAPGMPHVHDVNLLAPALNFYQPTGLVAAAENATVGMSGNDLMCPVGKVLNSVGFNEVGWKKQKQQNVYSYAGTPVDACLQLGKVMAQDQAMLMLDASKMGKGPKTPVNTILGSCDTTIDDGIATDFSRSVGPWRGFDTSEALIPDGKVVNNVCQGVPHGLFTGEHLYQYSYFDCLSKNNNNTQYCAAHSSDASTVASASEKPIQPTEQQLQTAPLNPAFPSIEKSTLDFIQKTQDPADAVAQLTSNHSSGSGCVSSAAVAGSKALNSATNADQNTESDQNNSKSAGAAGN